MNRLTLNSLILFCLLCPTTQIVLAQAPAIDAQALIDDLKMTSWPNDSIAEAGVIYDTATTQFVTHGDKYEDGERFYIHFNRSTRVKVLKSAGLSYSTIAVPLFYNKTKSEQIENIKGTVYNLENGKLSSTEFDTTLVYEEAVNNHYKLKKFALPNVKPGSVIDYSYTLVTPFNFNLPDWEFQWRIPVKRSSISVSIMPFYEYTFHFQGPKKFDKQDVHQDPQTKFFALTEYHEQVYNYESYDVPAFRDEEFIASSKDYLQKIDFQLNSVMDIYGKKKNVVNTWDELTKELIKEDSFGGYIADSKSDAKKSIAYNPELDTLSNLRTAIDYVKIQYSWNRNFQLSATKTVKAFTLQKTGNSAEINLYAIGLLNAIGIDAKPVLISTRKHGKIYAEYPFLDAFNHPLIYVEVGGMAYLCDATDPYYPFDAIPIECINEKGYLVDTKKPNTWLTLSNNKISDNIMVFDTAWSPEDDEWKTSINTIASNYEAIRLRKKYVSDKTAFTKGLLGNIEPEKLTVENLDDRTKRFTIKAQIATPVERSGNRIFIHPFMALCDQKNQFKAESRDYPIDLTYNIRRNYVSKLSIPEGYKVSSLPEALTISDPLLQFNLIVGQNGNTLTINGSYYFTKSIYPADDYLKLKELFNTIVTKLNQSIVLDKI